MNNEQRLAKINELSLHLRGIWIGLLVALVFVGITLMGHRDADFFAFGAATTLPVVSVNVHPTAFFLAAPILIAAIYIYLHIFLLSLWDHIGDAEAKFGTDDTSLSDHVSPTIFSLAAIWYRNRVSADGSMAPSVLGAWMVAIALGLGWAFGLFVLFLIWVRGMPLHDFSMTLVAALSLWAASLVAGLSLRSAEGRMRGRSRKMLATIGPTIILSAAAVLVAIVLISWERTKGGLLAHLNVAPAYHIPLATADLREAELTKRPVDWQPFEIWRASLGLQHAADTSKDAEIARLWQNRLDLLEAPDLSNRDLRGADLSNAFLPGTNLRGADLRGARLSGASLQGVNFRQSVFENVDLKHAALQGAVLSGLKIFRSDMSFSGMAFSDLFSSRILETNFSHANMSSTDLGFTFILGSNLVKADLARVALEGATLARSDFSGTVLNRVDLSSVFASEVQFSDVDLSTSDLSYTTFMESDFTNSKISTDTLEQTCFLISLLVGVEFLAGIGADEETLAERLELAGSTLTSANLTKLEGLLTQDMIASAYGGELTILPPGLTMPSHWHTGPVGALGGGATYTPPPPWFARTRQEMEASDAEDASNSSYVVHDGWPEWKESALPIEPNTFFCKMPSIDDPESDTGLFDAIWVDYRGLENDVRRILSPDWFYDPEPNLPWPIE